MVRSANCTYELSQEFAPSISGTHSAWITYEAYNDGPPYLVWTGSKDSVPMIIIDGTRYPNIQNIAFQGLYLDGQGSALSGFQCKSANGINFIANTVVDTDGAGVVANGCDYLISDHNLIMHNGYSSTAGASNTSGISYGMVPWADSYTGIHNAISNNIIVGEVDQSATPTDGNGIILDLPYGSNTTTPPALILNNIVYGNGGRCIETNQYVTNFWIVNNSCYKNALNIPSQQTYPEIQQQLNTSMTGINGVIANNISYSWTSSNPLTNKTILRLIRESHTLRICTSAGHANLPHFAMASSTQIRNLSRRHILIRRRAGSTPSGVLPCRGDRSTNQRRGVRSAELRDGFLRVIYTVDSPSPPLAPATAT